RLATRVSPPMPRKPTCNWMRSHAPSAVASIRRRYPGPKPTGRSWYGCSITHGRVTSLLFGSWTAWRVRSVSLSTPWPCSITMALFHERGVELQSLTENINTTTPSGKLTFHLFAALAEFERDLLHQRVTAGLKAARQRGRVGGRPKALTADNLKKARALLRSGETTKV